MKNLRRFAFGIAFGCLSGMANAGFIDMGDGTIRDTSTNLLWVKDWAASGTGNWVQQNEWASQDFASSSGWRLPTVAEYSSVYSPTISTTTPWINVRDIYWTSDPSDPVAVTCTGLLIRPGGCTARGAFAVSIGISGPTLASGARPLFDEYFAQKVRSYEESVTVPVPVPLPATLSLALLGLLAAATAKGMRSD